MQGKRYRTFNELAEAQSRGEFGGYAPVTDEEGKTVWYASTPSGMLAALRDHQVTEHEDGTVTVSPSIACQSPPDRKWHGFLERGVWREV